MPTFLPHAFYSPISFSPGWHHQSPHALPHFQSTYLFSSLSFSISLSSHYSYLYPLYIPVTHFTMSCAHALPRPKKTTISNCIARFADSAILVWTAALQPSSPCSGEGLLSMINGRRLKEGTLRAYDIVVVSSVATDRPESRELYRYNFGGMYSLLHTFGDMTTGAFATSDRLYLCIYPLGLKYFFESVHIL